MLQIQKKKQSFDTNLLNNKSKKKLKRFHINLNSKKDIFIRKQDIYLINLLEKRIKLTKILKTTKPEFNKIKLNNPFLYKINRNIKKESYDENKKNLFLNYRSISLINNKKKYENKSYDSYEKDKNNTMKNIDTLITSKIYNKDDSKNNKKILKFITGEKNFYDTKYNNYYNTLINSFLTKTKNTDMRCNNDKIKLPKIHMNKIRNSRNKSETNNIQNELRNFKTITIKRKKNYQTEGDISLTERLIKKDNIENDNNKDIYNEKDNYTNNIKAVFHTNSISQIKSIKNY